MNFAENKNIFMLSSVIHFLIVLAFFLLGVYFLPLSGLLLWFLVTSLYAFSIYAWDKMLAGARQRRISEANLYFLAAIGGFVGALLGMKIFRHKTAKSDFRLRFLLSCLIGFSVYTIWILKA